ncbi:hypothetical protein NEPAR06_2036 [Nematocida parisii]|uniref:Uncharacterized protein n=1 Tax=Nematocida parisii (strain ERTm3) TaxID=935791 RepID=I3EDV7_NEMP3|nr:uncharacterized protein NEPG_00007 [Nematocida parisii ERTm1]EIJ87404.1 hypothetical protein NEQG_02285 [Nematocida parisii ERTm3]KAI5129581.1 hypothetical protein NEPAR08_1657 [Nematocida parisii]EIJ94485.1 hypothetical protein NEPG_00007 [Nematocida parisii ERTm1]KAI5129609.1 hypothetical protein NEPAR03_1739 [Nematocida parisii]KAI5142227.1 hypothetical protein NEPAR04_1473 [Nematocida parisii]|eukprot:XP_013057841.1 hypothetical protein NEPG_00007 [Nematocida parisii ERTm1]
MNNKRLFPLHKGLVQKEDNIHTPKLDENCVDSIYTNTRAPYNAISYIREFNTALAYMFPSKENYLSIRTNQESSFTEFLNHNPK